MHVSEHKVFIYKHVRVYKVNYLDHVLTCHVVDNVKSILSLSNKDEKLLCFNDSYIGESNGREKGVSNVLACFRIKDYQWTCFELLNSCTLAVVYVRGKDKPIHDAGAYLMDCRRHFKAVEK
jgi:hypothetical protein